MQESSEEITLIEPLWISRGTAHWRELEDLVFELKKQGQVLCLLNLG
jgi:hypothetical protein